MSGAIQSYSILSYPQTLSISKIVPIKYLVFTHTHTHTHTHTVDKSNMMVGSYGPKTEVQKFLSPVEEAPSGMIARGMYTIKSKFTDDDKNIYLEWEWKLSICKDWAA